MLLLDRKTEQQLLDRLLVAVREGLSRVLVLRGEPGIGKSILLEYAVEAAEGMQVAQVVGVESEMNLGFAGLHQLLIPFMRGLERLPTPQRDALGGAFGIVARAPSDLFLVGLATLTLLADAATEQPLLCVIDDAQWVDQASAGVLGFVARRLFADGIGMLFAVRAPNGRPVAFEGLPEVELRGLPDGDAHELLASVATGRLDERVEQRIVAETGGNPMALVELGRELTEGELSGSAQLPEQLPLSSRLEKLFLSRVSPLPPETKTLLLLASAQQLGDPVLLWRAAEQLGISPEAAAGPGVERLLTLAPRVAFRHPLVRSAVYQGASPHERRQAHEALAAASDPELDPDRRAWHLAAASAGRDEQVAAELERCADRASHRGGHAATAAFLARAAELTPDPGRQAARRLAAAQANLVAGAPGRALTLVKQAAPFLPEPLEQAKAQRLTGAIQMALGQGHGTLPVLLEAARALLPLDLRSGRDALLEAMEAAIFFRRPGSFAEPREVALTARAAPPGAEPTAADLLLDGLAARFTDGYEAAVPGFRRAIAALRVSTDLRWFMLGCLAAGELWDLDAQHALASRWAALARQRGALTTLPVAMALLAGAEVSAGRLSAGDAIHAEAVEISAATGNPGLMGTDTRGDDLMSAWRGREAETRAAVAAREREALERGVGGGSFIGDYALTVLEIGLGHHQAALPHALRVYRDDLFMGVFVLPEVVEAAARAGDHGAASAALDRLERRATASGTPHALGLLARSQALMAQADDAEGRYLEAIAQLGASMARPDLARAHLLYGEWLRRQRRRPEARAQLRTALDMLGAMGLDAFAGRARAELAALGERLSEHGQD